MPLKPSELKPLTPTEIKIELLKRGVSIASLAREWNVLPGVVSRVIRRDPEFVYPEIRQKLADFLGVEVSRVGRDYTPRVRRGEEAEAVAV